MKFESKPSKLTSLNSADKSFLSHKEPTQIYLTNKSPRLFTKLVDYKELTNGMLKVNQVRVTDGKEQVISPDVQDGTDHKSKIISHDYVKFSSQDIQLECFEKRIITAKQAEVLFREDFNPVSEDLRIAKLHLLEHQESQLINNRRFGLKSLISKGYTIHVDEERPQPCADYLDEGLALVWKDKQHTMFVCHPMTKAAIYKEVMKDGSLMRTTLRSGNLYVSYAGVPIVESPHVPVKYRKDGTIVSDIFVVRTTSHDFAGYTRLGATPVDSNRHGDVFITELTINDAFQGEYHLAYYTSAVAYTNDCIARIKDVVINNRPNVHRYQN